MSADARCPVCGTSFREPPARCFCDYDFAGADPRPAARRLRMEVRHANRVWYGGLLALALLPFTFVAFAAYVPLATPLAFVVQLLGGTGLAGYGIARGHVARRKLRAADELMQLPAARVVDRDRSS